MSRDEAVKVAGLILADMLDRRGLRQQFESCDADIQQEIVSRWVDIVLHADTYAPNSYEALVVGRVKDGWKQ